MSFEFLEERVVDTEVREIAAGRREGRIPRTRAIVALARRRPADADRILSAVLADETAPASVRAVAAAGLAHVDTPEAVTALTAAARGANPAILAAVATGLARVGDARALPALTEMQTRTVGPLRRLAVFAAAIIAHRLGVEGHDLSPPADSDYVAVASATARPSVDELPEQEARECIDSLRDERLGVEYAPRPLYRITCDRGAWILVLSRAVLENGALSLLSERKFVFGVLARKRPDASGYSAGCYVLTAPSAAAVVQVFVPTISGELYWAGTARLEQGTLRARIRALARSGALPVDFDIRVREERFELLNGVFDHTTQTGREPTPD